MRHRHLALATVLALAALTAPSLAHAAPRTLFRFVPSYAEPYSSSSNPSFSYSAPALAGADVVWARSAPGGGWVVESARPGRLTDRIAASPRPPEGQNTVHTLRVAGGSPSRVSWTDSAFDVVNAHGMSYRPVRSRVVAAQPGGEPVSVAGCGEDHPCMCPPHCGDHTYPADLDGDVLAYVEGNYPDRRVVVDDLSSAEPPLRIEAGEMDAFVRVAGDHVVFSQFRFGSQPQTVVYDWRAHREVYRVPGLRVADLQADGKLVTADVQGRIVWYSPAEPQPHEIAPPPRRQLGAMRIAGDRIAFVHTRRYGADPVLAVSDLTGRTHDVGPASTAYGNLAFDGRRAAWTIEACGLVSVVLDSDVDRPGGDPIAQTGCSPPRIHDVGHGNGRIVVKASCPGGCRGILGVYALGDFPVRKLVTRRMNLRASSRVKTTTLVPSRDAERALARHTGPLRLQVRYLGRDGRGRLVGATKAGKVRGP